MDGLGEMLNYEPQIIDEKGAKKINKATYKIITHYNKLMSYFIGSDNIEGIQKVKSMMDNELPYVPIDGTLVYLKAQRIMSMDIEKLLSANLSLEEKQEFNADLDRVMSNLENRVSSILQEEK